MKILNINGRLLVTIPGKSLRNADLSIFNLRAARLGGFNPIQTAGVAVVYLMIVTLGSLVFTKSLRPIFEIWPELLVLFAIMLWLQPVSRAAIIFTVAAGACIGLQHVVDPLIHGVPTSIETLLILVMMGVAFLVMFGRLNRLVLGYFELEGVDLHGTDLTGSELTRIELTGANVERAILRNCKMNFARIKSVRSSYADYENTKMLYGRICDSDFSYTRMVRMRLKWCSFIDVDLRNSDLTGADLSATTMDRVVLNGANLQDAILDRVEMKRIKYDTHTVWPARMPITLPASSEW